MELTHEITKQFFALQTFVSQYPVTFQRRVLGAAVRGTAKPLVKELRTRYRNLGMPNLSKSVRLSNRVTSREATALFASGNEAVAYYLRIIGRADANLIEGGTKAHTITALGDKQALSNYRDSFYGKTVRHPGIRAYGVMRKSLEAAVPAMTQSFTAALEKSLDREFTRYLSGRKL